VLVRQCLFSVTALAAAVVANAVGGLADVPAPQPTPAPQQPSKPAATAPTPSQKAAATPAQSQKPAAPPAQSQKAAAAPAQQPQRQAAQHQAAPPPASQQQAATPAPEPFTFATVQRLARERAAQPYENRSPKLPVRLARLNYDQYRDIRFRRAYALWRNQSLFEVQFFHRGFNFDRRVEISEVVDGVPHPIAYNPSWFEFGRLVRLPTQMPADLGFAGFRVHFPLHTPAYKDELIVFLGASYFRVLGRNQVYGLSARGLAINTAAAVGEEFPWFTDFWLVRPPRSDQRTLTIYAVLDSESVAGAYQFEVRPGATTQVEVTCELYPRRNIEKLGIAPLTSMFLYGEDPSGHRFDDFRPEVHDSDALMQQTGGGEWLFRPLNNPRELKVNRFMDEHPRGFGLAQRDRDFSHYQDNESQFQRRPSYWIQPLGDWGKGGLELVEIPTDEEIHDNIGAYWVPSTPAESGKTLKFTYLLSSYLYSPLWPPGGKAIATRTGSATGAAAKGREDAHRVEIDFAGGDLDGLDRTQPVRAYVTANGGQADGVRIERLDNGVWRVSFRVLPAKGKQAVDLRCYLTLYGEALTETWTYQLAS
jgi:periplasmic glucans biosynthesis protein